MTDKPTAKLNLDLGCGDNCHPGFVGIDRRPAEGVEIIHDLEVFPWPVDDDSCSMLICSHLIEHIKPWLQVDFLNECWRVLKVGGILLISTPYGGSFRYNQDPTHCSPWNEATPEYFVKGYPLYEVYKPKPWKFNNKGGRDQRFWATHGDLEIAFVKVSLNGS